MEITTANNVRVTTTGNMVVAIDMDTKEAISIFGATDQTVIQTQGWGGENHSSVWIKDVEVLMALRDKLNSEIERLTA